MGIREILAEAPRKHLARSCGEDSRAVVAQYGQRLFSEQGGRREKDGLIGFFDIWIACLATAAGFAAVYSRMLARIGGIKGTGTYRA